MNKTQNENDLIELSLKRYELWAKSDADLKIDEEIDSIEDAVNAATLRVKRERSGHYDAV